MTTSDFAIREFVSLSVDGEPSDALRHRRVSDTAKTVALELTDGAIHFAAVTGDDHAALVEVDDRILRLALVRLDPDPDADAPVDQIELVEFGSLADAVVSRRRQTLDSWGGGGFVTAVEISHPLLPGGKVGTEFAYHEERRAEEIAAAVSKLVTGRVSPARDKAA